MRAIIHNIILDDDTVIRGIPLNRGKMAEGVTQVVCEKYETRDNKKGVASERSQRAIRRARRGGRDASRVFSPPCFFPQGQLAVRLCCSLASLTYERAYFPKAASRHDRGIIIGEISTASRFAGSHFLRRGVPCRRSGTRCFPGVPSCRRPEAAAVRNFRR